MPCLTWCIYQEKDANIGVKAAVVGAVSRIGGGDPGRLNAAQLFYDLSEKFYYGRASVVAGTPQATVWTWDQSGLQGTKVPPEIFNDIMAKREAENVLKLDQNRGDAVSLWLAADYKREADLPEGVKDDTHKEGTPNAHYYGVEAVRNI